MALVKRGKTWHAHFFVNGQRFRQSLKSRDWREAQAREKELIARALKSRVAQATRRFSNLNATDAIEQYLADRQTHVQPISARSESDHAKPLRKYFGYMGIGQINADSILAYIRHRKAAGLSNTTINMEIGILRRILKRAKRWHFVEDEIPHLPERRDVGRALQPEEKLRLLRIAQSKPEWETAYLASLLALNTTMRGCEIKQLRWRDIDLIDRSLTIRRSKTRAGERASESDPRRSLTCRKRTILGNFSGMSGMADEARVLRAFVPALVLLAICAVINFIDRGNLSIAAPLLKNELRISASQLGILLSAFFWTYTAMQFVSGWVWTTLTSIGW